MSKCHTFFRSFLASGGVDAVTVSSFHQYVLVFVPSFIILISALRKKSDYVTILTANIADKIFSSLKSRHTCGHHLSSNEVLPTLGMHAKVTCMLQYMKPLEGLQLTRIMHFSKL